MNPEAIALIAVARALVPGNRTKLVGDALARLDIFEFIRTEAHALRALHGPLTATVFVYGEVPR